MLFDEIELNSAMEEEIDAFFKTSERGKKADYITRQPENPNPNESMLLTPRDLTDEQAMDVLKRTNQRIWG